jgi:hypothetical protein
MNWRRAGLLTTFVLVTVGIVAVSYAPGQQPSTPRPRYAANHDLLAPTGFESWVFVGSNLGLSYNPTLRAMTAREAGRSASGQTFHTVYINPEAYAHFVATKEFPEPTILVMEQFAAADREPTGVLTKGVYNGQRVGVEVSVKNSARPDGSKTPWAYYDFTDPADGTKMRASATAQPDSNCADCHRDHAGRDRVWVQFYPVLRKLLP